MYQDQWKTVMYLSEESEMSLVSVLSILMEDLSISTTTVTLRYDVFCLIQAIFITTCTLNFCLKSHRNVELLVCLFLGEELGNEFELGPARCANFEK